VTGERVLVVEDNEKNRKLVRDVLRFHGYEVSVAGTAQEGLALAQAERPRLILLDIQLPDLDGTTALRYLRAEPETAAIPVVALTAYAMSGDRERFLGAGFNGYMAKPLELGTFAAEVRRYCDLAVQTDGSATAPRPGHHGGASKGRAC
jgi:two-component system cell cycle response regulator DivK